MRKRIVFAVLKLFALTLIMALSFWRLIVNATFFAMYMEDIVFYSSEEMASHSESVLDLIIDSTVVVSSHTLICLWSVFACVWFILKVLRTDVFVNSDAHLSIAQENLNVKIETLKELKRLNAQKKRQTKIQKLQAKLNKYKESE